MNARLFLVLPLLLFCGAAHGECRYKPFQFFPEQNDRINVPATVEPGGSCQHRFAEGGGYRFTLVAAERQPQHGMFQKGQDGAFVYAAPSGYVGPDSYTFKVCATKGPKSGCSLLTFDVDVRPQAAAAPPPSGCAFGASDAIPACTQIIDDTTKAVEERARAYKMRGIAQFRAHNYDAAIADFSGTIELAPQDAEAFSNRGLARQWRGDMDAALADYSRAVEIAPGLHGAFINRANARRVKGDLTGALADAAHAIDLAPNFGGGYKARGQVLAAQGKFADAIADYAKAIELSPADEDAHILRANALHRSGDDDKAFAEYATVVAAAPQHANAYVERGKIWLERGQFDKAADDFDSAVHIDPKSPVLLNLRGVALLQNAKFDAAIADFSAAFAAAPAQVGVLANRGFAWFAKGEFAAAAADFQKLADAKLQPAYAPLWIWLAKARAGETVSPPPPPADPAWPAPVYAYLAGKMTRVELFAAAIKGDQKTQDSQVCDASFYAGEQMLIEKRAIEADMMIRQAGNVCKGASLERAGALGEFLRTKR